VQPIYGLLQSQADLLRDRLKDGSGDVGAPQHLQEEVMMAQSITKPNVLIIQTDQQSCWTLGCYGGTLIPTPHIDSIAAEGVKFANFFANSAVCTPSRGSFLTGRYPHFHGTYRNGKPLNADEITIAHLLREQGYDTGYVGKWHLDGESHKQVVAPEHLMGFDD
jgi:uncharacterized sulfatase